MKRRELLRTLGLTAAAVTSSQVSKAALPTLKLPRKRVLRIAHITDVHARPAQTINAAVAKCFHTIQSLNEKPDVIFHTGDYIDDALGTRRGNVERQWKAWNKISKQENSLEIYHCIGNHDVWTGPDSKGDPLWGKKFASEQLELHKPYYSFDRAGWHFVVLDSTMIREAGYIAKLDEEQFAWLESDLGKVSATVPVMVLSHIPILGVSVFFDGENEQSGNWTVPGSWMHIDARRITELFYRHKNVKLCISGHIHLKDSVEYNGVSYFCNGAVCGNWWKGNYQQTPPGFALVNLYDDGYFDNEYFAY